MRKALFFAGMLALGFSSCTKDQVIVNTEPPKPPFRVSGISDISLNRNPFYFQQSILSQLNINVIYEYGEQKRVSLSVQDLPAGIKDSFYVRSGYPDFSTYLFFYDRGVQPGNYNAKLVATADGDSASISYPFNFTITGDTSCAGYFGSRTFSATNSCSGPNPVPPGQGTPYTVTSVRPNSAQNELLLTNYKNDGTGSSLRLTINCQSRNITVPSQVLSNNISVQGYGQLTNSSGNNSSVPNVLSLSLNERDGNGTVTNCNYYFQLL